MARKRGSENTKTTEHYDRAKAWSVVQVTRQQNPRLGIEVL